MSQKGKFLDLTKSEQLSRIKVFIIIYYALVVRLETADQKEQNKDIEKSNRDSLDVVKTDIINTSLTKVWLNELKSESTVYFDSLYNDSEIEQKFPRFNKEKFKKLSAMIDNDWRKAQIPQAYNDLLKWIVISESAMDKKPDWSLTRSDLERLYVFPEERERAIRSYPPWNNWPTAKIWSRARGKAYDIHNWHKNKLPWQNALWPFQMQTALFTKLIVISPELKKEVIQVLHKEFNRNSNKDQLVSILERSSENNLGELKTIMENRDLLNIMERLSYHPIAQKVAYEFIKDNEKTLTWMYKKHNLYLDHNDMLLSCGLAHLKWPSWTLDAVLQQNIYLIAESLWIDVSSIIWTWKPFQIDGAIRLEGKKTRLAKDMQDPEHTGRVLEEYNVAGWETWKLYQAIKGKLKEKWIRSLERVELQDIMSSKGADCRNNMTQRLQDTEKQLQAKWIQYNFEPLLSVCDLKPLQDSGKIHLRYIFHYLNSLQCDPNTEKYKKEERKQIILHWGKENKRNLDKQNPAKSNTKESKKPKSTKVEKWSKSIDKDKGKNEVDSKTQKSDGYNKDNSDLRFWRFRKQYVDFNKEGEIEKGNMSWLNWIRCMYPKPGTKNISNNGVHWDLEDIENNTRLNKVFKYKDIFNSHIKSESTIVFDQGKRSDSDYISSCIESLLEQAWWEKENIIVWFRKAAKVVDIIKDENGNFKDIIVAFPLFDKKLWRHTIQNLSVFGNWGLMSLHNNVYAAILK